METPPQLKSQRILSKVIIIGAVGFVGISLYFTPRWATSGSIAAMVPSTTRRTELKVVTGGIEWAPDRPAHPVSRTAPTPTPAAAVTESPTKPLPTVEWQVDNSPALAVAVLHHPENLWKAFDTVTGEHSVLGPILSHLIVAEGTFFTQSHDPVLNSLLPDGTLAITALRALLPVDSMLVVDAQSANLSAALLIPRRLSTAFTPLLGALVAHRSREVFQIANGPTVVRLQVGRYPLYVTELPEYFVVATDKEAVARSLVRQYKSGGTVTATEGDLVIGLNAEARFSPTLLKRVMGTESYRVTAGFTFNDDAFPNITLTAPPSPLYKALRSGIPLPNLRSMPADISAAFLVDTKIPVPGSPAESWVSILSNRPELPPMTPGGLGIAWDVTEEQDRIGISITVAPQPNETFSWWRKDLPQGRCGAQQIALASSDLHLYQSMREACDGVSLPLPQRIPFTNEELQSKALAVVQPGELLGGLVARGMPHQSAESDLSALSSRSQAEFVTATEDLQKSLKAALATLPTVVFRGALQADGSLEFISRAVTPVHVPRS